MNCTIARTGISNALLVALFVSAFAPSSHAQSEKKVAAEVAAPRALTTDTLTTPLGIDSNRPAFGWKLVDARRGAKQTAYEIRVATGTEKLRDGTASVWDSGRVASDASVGVRYGGPELSPMTRYYWRVQVWDQDGKPYPASDTTWWETGIGPAASTSEWAESQWIGYEDPEHELVREADAAWITNPPVDKYEPRGDTRHDFRLSFDLKKPVKRAVLYATGQDTVSAWVNGTAALEARPLPPYEQMAWKKYVSADVTRTLHVGPNTLAIEALLYSKPRGKDDNLSRTPMNATLYMEYADGTAQVLKSGDGPWKATLNASGEWHGEGYDDASWPAAIVYETAKNDFGQMEQIGKPWATGPVKMLRRKFTAAKPVRSARLYATALGAYEFHMNGERVGDQILAPGWMDFREHVPYQTYDVTSQVRQGANAIGALLAPGWYSTPLMWFGQGWNYGVTPPAIRAVLRIEYADGSVGSVSTDGSWKADVSPILFAEIYDGETYDARREQAGWDSAGFRDADWHAAERVRPNEPKIESQYFEPIREERTTTAKAITNPKPGVWVYDFGQNLAGVPRLRVSGPAGTDVRLRFAEIVNDDGTIYIDNLRTAKATDHFILAGKGAEEFQPKFTFHGFRYAEITGLAGKPDAETLKAVVIHTDAPFSVELKTGSAMINQLWSNILWGQRSNFVGVPTDCPQRDERLGWAADAQVFWRAASYNMSIAAFSEKFAGDFRGTQSGTAMYGIFAPGTDTENPGYGTGWSDAGVIIPWTSWIQTGDTRVIEENWDAMEKYLGAIGADNPDHLWKKNYGIPFGDWLAPEGPTPENLIATAYWAYDVDLMRQMAHATGRKDAEGKYTALFGDIREAFQKAYVRDDGFVGAVQPASPFDPEAAKHMSKEPMDSQTTYVLALHMNLLPDALRPLAAKRLVDLIAKNNWRLGTGFLGTPYLLEALTTTGHSDVAYRLLLNTDYPSWGYLVDKGATTMWERWNGDQMKGQPGMNSYNHYAYGAVADWVYRYAAGIDTVESDAAFHTILLHPTFDARLGSLDFAYESAYGKIESSWKVAGGSATWTLVIPPNASGRLPLTSSDAARWKLDGKPLAANQKLKSTQADSGATFEMPAGRYAFTVKLQ
jgi:alpha-L-rhamnosidase